MLLKYRFVLDTFFESPAPVQISPSTKSSILIRTFKEDENDIFEKFRTTYGSAMCETTLVKEPSKKNLKIFQELAQNKIPEDVKADIYLKKGDHLNLSNFPKHFIEFCEQSESEAEKVTEDVWSLFRWKFNLPNPHNPFEKIDKTWSLDGSDWKKQPAKDYLMSYVIYPYRIRQEDCDIIATEFKKGVREPLAHKLFREAWSARFRNKSSSIVIGVAALETSVKSFVTHKIPEASWLISELQSPPILSLIKEFIPTLITPDQVNAKYFSISEDIIEQIRKGVTIRNDIVHGKTSNFDVVSLSNILVAIKYIIYLLDYHSGNEWAKRYARLEMINVQH